MKQGFAMVEVLVSMAISSLLLMAFLAIIHESIKINSENADSLKAELYLREAIEASKDMEASDWVGISAAPCYAPLECHPAVAGSAWQLAAGAETLDGKFSRKVSLEEVYRNQLVFPNEIVATPGVFDPNTIKVRAAISWESRYGPKILTLENYVYQN